jgi:glycine cleavage system H protein
MSVCNVGFLMGKFEARFPDDRRYSYNHMWCLPRQGRLRFGFAAYAVRLLQEVFFLDWDFAAPAAVKQKDVIGRIESSKAESSLYAPLTGTIAEFNPALLKDPSAINADNYEAGWLFEMEADPAGTMIVQDYVKYLEAEWKRAEKLLKGQVQ